MNQMRRLLALVVVLVLTGGPAFAATPSPHHSASRSRASRASRERVPAPKSPVGISFTSVGPGRYLTPHAKLTVRGTLVNQSQTAYDRMSVRLLFDNRRFTSRGELDAYAGGKGLEPTRGGPLRTLPTSLAPDGQQNFSVSLPVPQMGLTDFGVYPVSVEAYNSVGALLGRQRTLVTYYPGTQVARTKIAWVWPMIDQPHRADDDTFTDDRLERQFGGGRLNSLVTAAARTNTPVSWLVDPSLIDDAAQMAAQDGYTLKDDVHRAQNVAAGTWLGALRSAIGGEPLVATPYADPDVMALAQHRMTGDIKTATDAALHGLGRAGLNSATTTMAAPPDGLADQATLSALAKNGARTVLLSSTVLPDLQAQTYTPNPLVHRSVGGTDLKLIAYDDTLNKVLGTGTSAPGATVLAEQRFLAETAMITGEMPNNSRTIVVTPPRRWNPSPAFAKAVLSYSAHAPWLRPTTMSNVEASTPQPRTFQPQKDSTGLSTSYLRQVRTLNSRVRRFTSIFQPPQSGFILGVPRAESSAWAGKSRSGASLRRTLTGTLDSAMAKVHVLNDNGYTMAGKSGQIPVTVSNGLDVGTVRVHLRASSQNDTRLRVNSVDRDLTLEPGHKDTIILKMKASANGQAYVNLELLAPDGHPFGDTRVVRVNATGYGRTALLITGISLAVLFLGVGIRVVRRRADRAEESVD